MHYAIKWLRRATLRAKLTLLVALAALAVAGSIGLAASLLHERMFNDRIDKLRTAVHLAVGLAQSLEDQVAAHRLTQAQALEQFRQAAHVMRFDSGTGYIYAQTLDNMFVVHGTNPKLEGTASKVTDSRGRSLTSLIAAALRNADEGVVNYAFPKPGQTMPQPKVAYVARFAPWNLVFAAGAYTDDLDAAFRAVLSKLVAVGGVILGVTLLAAWLIGRDIRGSLERLRAAMAQLASGDLNTEIPGIERGDEAGQIANSVMGFKDHMLKLAASELAEHQRAEAEKRAALVAMAETIEREAAVVVDRVSHHTGAMTTSADHMRVSAERAGVSAHGSATAAAQALANAQTVASAAEQLTASIREIGTQVEHSSEVVSRAVAAGTETRATIATLSEQVTQIGVVADMINDIAARTNLLALNATIEAARAGDAGKGFAVVASEVKQLAMQTARSTEEIGRHIARVGAATSASVAAVARMEQTVNEINEIAGSIAAAMEQQGAATAEISRSVAETANAANQVTERTAEVSAEAAQTGHRADEFLDHTTALDAGVKELRRVVMQLVRTASAEADRRKHRRRPCLTDATITCQGKTASGVLRNISEGGCFAETSLQCGIGQRIDLFMDRFGMRQQGTTVYMAGDGVGVAFSGDGLQARDADRISLETIPELVRLAKGDHVAFVKKVVDAVAAGEKLPHGSLPTEHHCRLGRWYDGVSDPATRALGSFKALNEPHQAVHDFRHPGAGRSVG